MPLALALASELCTARIFSPNLGCTGSWGQRGRGSTRLQVEFQPSTFLLGLRGYPATLTLGEIDRSQNLFARGLWEA